MPFISATIAISTSLTAALLLAGVPVHVVSRRLGHADVQTTLNRYAHVTEDAELQAVADWKALSARWRATVQATGPTGAGS
jgi:integrase